MADENKGNNMSPADASELLLRMMAIASDLWRDPPEDVVPEPKKQEAKPAKVVVKKPKIGIENLWMTADETIEWTDALAHEWPTDGLTPRSLWEFYHKHAEAVLNGDLTAYTEVLRKANPLGELMEYAHTPGLDGMMFAAPAETMSLPTFNGPIHLANTLDAPNVAGCPGLHNVVFEPGVYNAWHTHAGGQVLIVTDGIGYHQIEGQPVEVLRPGDVAMCPPGVKHWHGATPGSRFAHLAANTNPDKPGVEWFDLLPEEEYNKLPKE